MSKGNCEDIINYIISHEALNDIMKFQQSPSKINYDIMINGIYNITTPTHPNYYRNYATNTPPGLILYITVADGSLAYNSANNPADSGNSTTNDNAITSILDTPNESPIPFKNSFSAYQTFNLFPGNNNFNTRGYAMSAILSANGIGVEQKWSTVAQQSLTYYAYRTGFSQQQCFGLIVVALPTLIFLGGV